MIDGVIDILILLVMLVGLVLVHELGHFVMAKRAGVRVHEFGIGFPPRAATLFSRGGTMYTLNWLPIGGFVRLEGEEGESADSKAFVNQGLGTRLRILIAGVIVNFVVAWVIFTLIALFADPVFNVRVGGVLPGSPAQAAGVVPGRIIDYTEPQPIQDADGAIIDYAEPRAIYDDSGDLILAIDGQQFSVFDEILSGPDPVGYRYPPLRYLAERPAETVSMSVQRLDGSIEEIEVTLRSAEEAEELGALGVSGYKVPQADTQNGVVDAVVIGLERTLRASTLVLRGVASLIGSILEGPDAELEVAGPVGIVSMVGDIRAAAAPVFLLFFVGLLSANLAVINALPFPPMDGGRIMMALVQAASRDRVSPAAERMVYLTGFVLLMVLLAWVTVSDIGRLAG